MFPYYLCTIIFLTPYLVVVLLYTAEMTYYVREINEDNAVIMEPDYDIDKHWDLSDVTILQSCILVCGWPCILCIQCIDLCNAVKRAYQRHYNDSSLFSLPTCCKNDKKVDTKEEVSTRKKKRNVFHRLFRTMHRVVTGVPKKKVVQPVADQPGPNALELRDLQQADREQQERIQREALQREQERERALQLQREQEAAEQLKRRQQEELEEAARRLNERHQREMEEKAKSEEMRQETVLSVNKFKSLWASLPSAGAFQCNLKMMPIIGTLTEHLKKQGFHVVFATTPTPNDIEVGICNNRDPSNDNHFWFMARFLVANNSFSAAMKSQNADQVHVFVKKFALAKVLKIESNK